MTSHPIRDKQERILSEPKVTTEYIESLIIKEQYHNFPGTAVVTCALTLTNGFVQVGVAGRTSMEDFDIATCKKVARENAIEDLYPKIGFCMKEEAYKQNGS